MCREMLFYNFNEPGGQLMPIRNAKARWEGGLPEGRGSLALGSGAFEGQYSYGSRFEEGKERTRRS